jgi:peroxiredoxin
MKRIGMYIGWVLTCMAWIGPVSAAVAPGQMAPDFTLTASDKKTYHLAEFRGKYVVLEWFNRSCPFVQKHYLSGNMQSLQDTYLKKGVIWFSISSSAPGKEGYMTQEDAVQERIKDKARSTATLLDPMGQTGRAYGAKTTPHMFVINPKGQIVYAGAIDDHPSTDTEDIPKSRNFVAQALDQALAGKPVQTPTTQPYGCSVKYK